MNLCEPCGQVAVLGHGGGNTRRIEDDAVRERSSSDDGSDEYSYAERMAADQLRGRYHVASLPLLPVAQYSEGEGCGQSVGENVHWRVPGQHADERLRRVFDFADHAGRLLVASGIPHVDGQPVSE